MSHNDKTLPVTQGALKEVGAVTRWVLRRVGQNRVATPLALAGLTAASLLLPGKQQDAQEIPGDPATQPDAGNSHHDLRKAAFVGGTALTTSAVVFGPKAKKMLTQIEQSAAQRL